MIIDTFIFNKDFNALEIRLEELSNVVDLFIISECNFSHTGIKKPLYLTENINKFRKFESKIKVVSNSNKIYTTNPRLRELYQRELISKFLKKIRFSKSDVIIHSDCDEIPRNTVIRNLSENCTSINALIELKAYSTRLNLYEGLWARVRVVSGANYKSIAKLRQDIFLFNHYDLRRHKIPLIRVPDFFTHRFYGLHHFPQLIVKKPELQIIKDGGWHFNNLFEYKQIIEKIKNSSHYEWNTNEVMEKLEHRYLLGQDIYTGKQFKVVNVDNSFPTTILQNISKWSEFIMQEDDLRSKSDN